MSSSSALPRLIETPAQLSALCRELVPSPWLALDTEFHREKTYRPRLCLLQVAAPGLCACIDTLRLPDLDPLLDVLYDSRRTKVFHSAGQDLEVLYGLRAEPLRPLFDTQIAAPLLGHRDQISYAGLVEALLGVHLAKGETRTDWRRRPLSPAQLSYAADDVIYLARIYPLILDRLQELGRLSWLEEDCRRLSDPARYRPDPEGAWLRFRNGRRLPGRQRAALRALAAWRERKACREDRPRGWILRDDRLLAMASELPENKPALRRLAAGQRLDERSLDELLAIVRDIRQHQGEEPGGEAPAQRLRPEEQALVDRLLEHVRRRCREAGIETGAVTGRRELGCLIRGHTGLRLLQGWRRHFVGEELLAMVRREHR